MAGQFDCQQDIKNTHLKLKCDSPDCIDAQIPYDGSRRGSLAVSMSAVEVCGRRHGPS